PSSLLPIAGGVGPLEIETESRPTEIGTDASLLGHGRAVEQHRLDAHMVMEPFEMAQPGDGAAGMQMQGGRGMGGEVEAARGAQRADLEKAGETAAPCRVGLQHIDGLGIEHAAEIEAVIAILAGGDLHAVRRPRANEVQLVEMVA